MTETFHPDRPKPKRNASYDWLLWWRVDQDELDRQVYEYKTLRLWQSMRGISFLCLLLSATITVLFAAFNFAGVDAYAFVDAGLMLGCGLFIHFGHRWAMIAAMLLWTLEKVMGVVSTGGAGIIVQLIWWAAYMHAFFFAFRVEQTRRRVPPPDIEVFR
ncbi:MAG: hypothetical protein ISS15_17940 [Alphaproteobacteria bacterium]|nr:hypothetical protein [Alphaproteobacteria bacterium]MBL6938951.1 hypothetical protein [Alphaproteobacteria bacterium]MBL7099543.1 hypothetical protein [Alphaproteobacteria bacterium]